MKVVFDADIVVAAIRSRRGASAAWLRAGLRRDVEMLLSVPLMLQYEAVVFRAEHQAASRLTPTELGRVLDAVAAAATPVTISFLWRPILRDPDDELVLETAVNGGADLLLTFNRRDFGEAGRFGVEVMAPGPASCDRMEASR